MHFRVLAGLILAAAALAGPLQADEPQMLLNGSWAHLPTAAEQDACPLPGGPPARLVTVPLTCDIDADGKLVNCQTDERATPVMAQFALCLSRYFEVRPGVSGRVFVPIGIGGPAPRPTSERGRRSQPPVRN